MYRPHDSETAHTSFTRPTTLNEQGIPTARGGEWSSPQVMRILERLDPFREEEAAAA
jgi:hypothetical protein